RGHRSAVPAGEPGPRLRPLPRPGLDRSGRGELTAELPLESGPDTGKSHRQRLQRAHAESWPPLGRVARQSEIAQAAQQRADSDLALHPGQRRTDAEVRAIPEAEVGVRMPL